MFPVAHQYIVCVLLGFFVKHTFNFYYFTQLCHFKNCLFIVCVFCRVVFSLSVICVLENVSKKLILFSESFYIVNMDSAVISKSILAYNYIPSKKKAI